MHAATEWYVQLSSGTATEGQRVEWQRWRQASQENERAWQNIEKVTQRFGSVPSQIGLATLSNTAMHNRRRALKHMAVLFAVGTSSWLAYKEQPWIGLIADYTTGAGETRQVMLADGTSVFLNTDTAIKTAINTTQRTVTLLRGEIVIESGHELFTSHPLIVSTTHGAITALGTQFSVLDQGGSISVSVFEGAVKIVPAANTASTVTVVAGESIRFDSSSHSAKGVADITQAAWTNGFIVADGMPLAEFLARLSRYSTGLIPRKLNCNPAVANLLISGSFPINDIDQSLAIVAQTLPVRVDSFTRFWLTVNPA